MSTQLSEAMKQPLAVLQSISSKGAQASEAKREAAKNLLTERWLGKLLKHVGEIMVATGQEGAVVESDLATHRLQLKVVPIVQVDDVQTVVSEPSRVPEGIRDHTKDEEATEEDESDGESSSEEDEDASGAGESSDDDSENGESGSDDNSEEGSTDETDANSDDGSSEDEDVSDSDADRADSGIDIPPHLPTYRPGRTQVFVCNHVPKDFPPGPLLEQLATTAKRIGNSKAARCYVMKSRKPWKPDMKAWVVVILDRITKESNFTVHHNGQHLHFGPYFGGAKCGLCGLSHLLVDCERFSHLNTPNKKHKHTLMGIRPRLLGSFKR